MGYSIQMKVNETTLFTVYGRRLTNRKTWNDYEYQVVSTPKDFYGDEPDENRVCTMSVLCKGKLKHNYDDGLMVLCEKTLQKINKQLKEKKLED